MGVVHVIDSLHNHNGRMPGRNLVNQIFSAIVALISGLSAGREAPSIHIGAAVNSLIAQRMHLPNNALHLTIGCGTAAAISAAFNTPLAGVIFAMEVVLMEYSITGFMPIILASACGSMLSTAFYGTAPAFLIPHGLLANLWELPLVIPLGLTIGFLAALFIRIQRQCQRFHGSNFFVRILVVGLLTASVALFVPGVMGVGYDSVNLAIDGKIGLLLLITLIMAKLITTAVSYGLGAPIGIIGPIMVIGGLTGGVFALAGSMLSLEVESSSATFVLLGMGAMMAATLNAPLAALTAVLELTGSTSILMPAMIAIVSANLINRVLFGQQSAFTHALSAAGILVTNSPVRKLLRRTGVSNVIQQDFVEHQGPLQASDLPQDEEIRWLILREEGKRLLYDLNLLRSRAAEQTEEVDEDILAATKHYAALPNISSQASLHEALEVMIKEHEPAVFVSGVIELTPVSGIILRSRIEEYYLNMPDD